MKKALRWIGIFMLVVAIFFLAVALTHPELGEVFYIGGVAVGSAVWRTFYVIYAVVTVALIVMSYMIRSDR